MPADISSDDSRAAGSTSSLQPSQQRAGEPSVTRRPAWRVTSRPLRVCLVCAYDLAEEGGVRKHVLHLAGRLRDMGDEVLIVGPYSGREPLPRGTVGLPGVIDIFGNESHNRLGVFTSPQTVRRIIKTGDFDVLHVHEPALPAVPWYATWSAASAVRVATFHAHNANEFWGLRALRVLCRPQMSLFDRAIGVSRAAEEYARVYWPGPLSIIPNGVDTSCFTPGAADRGEGKSGQVRLLFVGQWHHPRKGLGVLLQAVRLLRSSGLDVVLDLVGEGPPNGEAPAEPGVAFHRQVRGEAALAPFYQSCDLFIAPSTGSESFGMVLLEAMASARPIVCSDIDGYRGVAPPEAARFVPPANADQLACAIRELAADAAQRQQMGAAGRAASLGYDWSAVVARIREEYVAALDARAQGTLATSEPQSTSCDARPSPTSALR